MAAIVDRIQNLLLQRRLRPFLLTGVVVLTLTQMLALSPSTLEEGSTRLAAIDPDTLVDRSASIIKDLPKRVADYSVDGFNYVSTHGKEKEWMIDADKADMFNTEKLVHSRKVKAYLYDADGKTTVVTGRESVYYMNKKDLEVFGDVHTVLPDGFEVTSEYMRYRPQERVVHIPESYDVAGKGQEKDGQRIEFQSKGMEFAMAKSLIHLPREVRFTMVSPPKEPTASATMASPRPALPERTEIVSDFCDIDRVRQVAHFDMFRDARKKVYTRFTQINQNTMYARSRNADVNYGDFSKMLNYMVAYEDVYIIEKDETDPWGPPPERKYEHVKSENGGEGQGDAATPSSGSKNTSTPSKRYATGGRADFDTKKNIIVLTRYPQVYQDGDTVTGDVILMHRDTDIVEVEHSNSFSEGDTQNEASR